MTHRPRFYCPVPLHAHQSIVLPDNLAHYARRVLRLKSAAPITLFDGHGGEYPAHLDYDSNQTYARTEAHHPREAELAGHINLIQGLATADKMDWIIEKAVELGAMRVVPITAQRSVLQLRGDRLEKRVQHWQRISQAASEQCGRNRLLKVERPCTLAQFLETKESGPHIATFLCHPDGGIPLNQAIREFASTPPPPGTDTPALNLIIGPEGGWTDQELTLAHQHGAQAVQFGSRIMRTETAGLALIAASTALLDWDGQQG